MSKKLLLADDSVTIQKVVGLVFANGDYDLQCVSNGDAAFEKIFFERPDIVLADVNMPGKNGFELCSAIKNNPASSQVPVLLLVGSFDPFDEDQARSAGADGWIVKPFDSQALIDEVEGLLSQPAEAVPRPEPGGGADVSESAMWADMESDSPDMEAAADAVALDQTFNGEPDVGDVVLEEEILLEEDQPATEEPQPEDVSATVEEVLAEEEEILFIDEGDLLDDEPEQITVSSFVEPEPPAPELDVPVEESDAPVAEPDPFALETDAPTTETDSPAEDSLPVEPVMEMPPEPAAGLAPAEVRPAVEVSSHPAPEKAGLDFWRNESLIDRLATATAPEPQAVSETPPSAGEHVETDASDVAETVVPEVQDKAEPCEEEVTVRVQALSEEELGCIVERVAGTVIERLAGSILEKIAWEVVPDLAESLIKEEIRKITETSN